MNEIKRPPLSPHQRSVLNKIERHSKLRPVSERQIGSEGGINKLIMKGYVHVAFAEQGPRGGIERFLLPGGFYHGVQFPAVSKGVTAS